MLNKELALKIFEGFNIQRWNDIPRPYDLVEMDKSGEKMVLSYLIGKYEEEDGKEINWEKIIYSGFFELLKKIVLSDIKASVHRMIKETEPEEFIRLNNWVVDRYKSIIKDKNLLEKFRSYLDEKEDINDLSNRVLKAAHKLSTLREFELVKCINPHQSHILKIENELNKDILPFLDLSGVQRILTKQMPYDFLCIVDKLRFQSRWSQTPRIPKTSVLGHSYFVAVLSLLIGSDLQGCKQRLFNNFYCSIFHDLPEAVTRDIISPVKRATPNLPRIVATVEKKIVKDELYPTVDRIFLNEIKYFTEDEFKNRVIINRKKKEVSFEDINSNYNEDHFKPVDGRLIEVSDKIAAFLEADQSIAYGITSPHIIQGWDYIYGLYENAAPVCGFDVSKFVREFSREK